ncbi:MAG: DNA translocase FtsK [bacterium]|nr:DNA translocase FtsK [bacterium]
MSRKKDRKKEKSSLPFLHPETMRGVIALLLFLGAIVMLLAFGGLGGAGGEFASSAFHRILGRGFLLVPMSLILAALSIFTSLHERFYAPTFLGSGLFLVSFEGLLHLFFPDVRGGGFVGYAIAVPLMRLLSFWPTLVILTGLIVISLIIAFNIPLRLILFAKKDPLRQGSSEARKQEKAIPAYLEERKKPDASPALPDDDASMEDPGKAEAATNSAPLFEIKGVGIAPASTSQRGEEERPVSRVSPRIAESQKNARKEKSNYVFPPLDLLEEDSGEPSSGDIKTTATVIKRALATFGIEVEMGEVNIGPTVTQYTLRPASGIKLSKITALQSDLSLALAAHPIRIEAPIPGRSLVGIEIPNHAIMLVRMRNLVSEEAFRKQSSVGLSLVLGRDVAGNPTFGDLERMPHLLIAGATGSGKSIGIHSVLVALLYQNAPENLRFILIDPKRVELTHYNDIPHLLTPVITEPLKMVHALRWAVREMETRYERLSKAGARDITSYNKRINSEERLPYIVIVIDELADIMAAFGRDVEGMIVRLAQMARATGIHLIVSTQRPSVEVITGLIKANITSRIAFQVASQVDSRTILDMAGAEKLLGRGDMLYLAGDAQKPKRIQSAFVSEKEVERVTAFIRKHNAGMEIEETITKPQPLGIGVSDADDIDEDDPMVDQAQKLVQETGKASATFLQRHLRIGYARAARILDILEARGVVGPGEGAKPREVYPHTNGAQLQSMQQINEDMGEDAVDDTADEESNPVL